MDEPFQLPVIFGSKEYLFDAQLYTTTYQYRIEVLVKDIPFSFERDDEGNFRAIAVKPDDRGVDKINPGLLQAVADSIREILS